MKRLIADIILFGSILILPWWAVCILALVFVLFTEKPIEAVIVAFILDLLYVPTTFFLGPFMFLFTFIFIALFFVLKPLKRSLTFYELDRV